MFERVYPYLVPAVAVLAGALAVSAASGCHSDPTQHAEALDRNQDGICDGDPADPGDLSLPQIDPEAPAHPAPLMLALETKLALGTDDPAALRAALIYVYQPFGVGTQPARSEVFATDFGSSLPARMEIAIDEVPAAIRDLQESIRADIERLQPGMAPAADEIPVSAYVVLYDDVNGDGMAGIGTEYLTVPHPADDASDAEWGAYYDALHAYHERYGSLSFYELSSPTDANNEIVAAAPLSVWFGRDAAGREGYRVFSETRTCEEFSDGATGCQGCWSEQREVSFGDVHAVTIDWQIAD